MEIIIPAAGLSTRFPNTKPKYLLHDYTGKIMLYRAVESFLGKHNITIGILAEHDNKFNAKEIIERECNNQVNVIILNNTTFGPAATVYEIISKIKTDYSNPLLIKDCDSFFEHEIVDGNYICVSQIKDHSVLYNISNKSFVIKNDQNIIQHIVEKTVISDMFCVGGYKFETMSLFIDNYLDIKDTVASEIFVSHVIGYAINKGSIWQTNPVHSYIDVGTSEDWLRYYTRQIQLAGI
jgi:choline kinase